MKNYIFLTLVMLVALAACGPSQETNTTATVDQQQAWYSQYQPIPEFTFSLERAEAIQLYTARNEARSTYTYSFSMTGNILFGCASRGFPLPYGVQLTNPYRTNGNYYDGTQLAQPEPNGLYTTGITTSSTWYMCDRPQGLAAVYSEPDVMAFPFPVQLVNGTLVDINQDASFTIDLTRPANIPTSMP